MVEWNKARPRIHNKVNEDETDWRRTFKRAGYCFLDLTGLVIAVNHQNTAVMFICALCMFRKITQHSKYTRFFFNTNHKQ